MDSSTLLEFKLQAAWSPTIEICGLLLGKNVESTAVLTTCVGINNIDSYPETGFKMDPKQVLDVLNQTTMLNKKARFDLCGMIHTHPRWMAKPSAIDIQNARNGLIFEIPYFIYSPLDKELGAYIWNGKNFEDLKGA